MVKGIAEYGRFLVSVPVRQRYWKWAYHRTGSEAGKKWYKKRVWKKTSRMKKVVKSGRFEFTGSGKDLYRAIIETKVKGRVPRGYIEVPADDFLLNPDEYSTEGEWIDIRIESN